MPGGQSALGENYDLERGGGSLVARRCHGGPP